MSSQGVKLADGVLRFANELGFRAYVYSPPYPAYVLDTDRLDWPGRWFEFGGRVRYVELRFKEQA